MVADFSDPMQTLRILSRFNISSDGRSEIDKVVVSTVYQSF